MYEYVCMYLILQADWPIKTNKQKTNKQTDGQTENNKLHLQAKS